MESLSLSLRISIMCCTASISSVIFDPAIEPEISKVKIKSIGALE